MHTRDGRGSYFFTGQGGAGRGKAKNLWDGVGNHPLPTVWGRAGKGSESAGLGADLEFVATVATGGRVKFLSAV